MMLRYINNAAVRYTGLVAANTAFDVTVLPPSCLVRLWPRNAVPRTHNALAILSS